MQHHHQQTQRRSRSNMTNREYIKIQQNMIIQQEHEHSQQQQQLEQHSQSDLISKLKHKQFEIVVDTDDKKENKENNDIEELELKNPQQQINQQHNQHNQHKQHKKQQQLEEFSQSSFSSNSNILNSKCYQQPQPKQKIYETIQLKIINSQESLVDQINKRKKLRGHKKFSREISKTSIEFHKKQIHPNKEHGQRTQRDHTALRNSTRNLLMGTSNSKRCLSQSPHSIIINKKVWSDKMLRTQYKRAFQELSHQHKDALTKNNDQRRVNSSRVTNPKMCYIDPQSNWTKDQTKTIKDIKNIKDMKDIKDIKNIQKIMLLKTVQNSTWAQLNSDKGPHQIHRKNMMAILSKEQKKQRNQILAERQSAYVTLRKLGSDNRSTFLHVGKSNDDKNLPKISLQKRSSSLLLQRNKTPLINHRKHQQKQSLKRSLKRQGKILENPFSLDKFRQDYIKGNTKYVQ